MFLPAEIIRAKRDGGVLSAAEIGAFVRGLVDGSWSDAQAAALAMAIVWRGMDRAETAALAEAMTHSGEVLDWRAAGLGDRPVLDKHSTGGVGDKVSLMLAPIVAACGGLLPMISGRGLGHSGGTLDKLEALPGYTVDPPRERLHRCLREAGCAIVGAGATLAPADRRLYALRDVTATVESLPLIVASILSKKRAAGLQALVMDVKFGSGAFMPERERAAALAQALVDVAGAAGLPTRALLSDMDQVLGTTAGNALEVAEALAFLKGEPADPRLLHLTLELSGRLLAAGGLAGDDAQGHAQAAAALADGRAAEHFARMVAALGGPADVLAASFRLPAAPVQCPVPAPADGHLAAWDVRALGLAVVALGGGRVKPGDAVDPRVGLAGVKPLAALVARGEPLAWVHAADESSAEAAVQAVRAACRVEPGPPTAALQARARQVVHA
jgi:thymidine phosphorylase